MRSSPHAQEPHPRPASPPADTEAAEYWDGVATAFGADAPSATWRAYMQASYRTLIDRWFAGVMEGPTLKTDLFEEAVTPYHLFDALGPEAVGVDLSPAVVRAAAQHVAPVGSPRLLVGDLRALPLATASCARVLSGSSLDHFQDKADLATALRELVRCLRPGGCLIVTLDNPHNPVVRLRNWLPFPWLARVGLVPYFVGATYSRSELVSTLTDLGLRVTHVTAMSHVPRAPAIWCSDLLARWRGRAVVAPLLSLWLAGDRWLDGWAGEFRTGYYLAVRAEKP
jgi:SAM-dependent methyltransferase